jgi:hypothetical protein
MSHHTQPSALVLDSISSPKSMLILVLTLRAALNRLICLNLRLPPGLALPEPNASVIAEIFRFLYLQSKQNIGKGYPLSSVVG